MLGRAVSNYEPPSQKRDAEAATKAAAARAAAAKPSSSPAAPKGIDDMLKNNARNSSTRSIRGWSNGAGVNSPSSSQDATPPTSSNLFRTYSPSTRPTTASTDAAYNSQKRSVNGLSGIVGSRASFEDMPAAPQATTTPREVINLDAEFVDLTKDEAPSKSHVPAHVSAASDMEFDPNDIEDDDELDLDMEYPLSLPTTSAPRLPLNSVSVNDINSAASMPPPKQLPPSSQPRPMPSSAMTWSSSPSAHQRTPPRAAPATIRLRESEPQPVPLSSEPSVDANPRPAKRRTTPWAQRAAEEREKQIKQEEEGASAGPKCFRCGESGHYVAACPKSRKPAVDVSDEFTPLPRESSLPWNTTASAVKDQQKAFKNQQKMIKEQKEKAAKADMLAAKELAAKAPKPQLPEDTTPGVINLSTEQLNVLDLVIQDEKSVFFTGSAGTGKSVLMQSIIMSLRHKYRKHSDAVAVTASTGLAACNIGGVTLHSFSGIGLGKEKVPDLVKKISQNPKAKNRWKQVKVLVIDEVSMVDAELFDKLESVARRLRRTSRPFGGIQLVITGDFFQLPPVPDRSKEDVKFAFDAKTWATTINHTIGLTQVFRQRDPEFASMLNEMRVGTISDSTLKAFRRLDRPLGSEKGVDATELFPTRNEVENSNYMKMRQLKTESQVYPAEDGGSVKDKQQLERLLSNFMAPKRLELKVGAQVMLIKNMDGGLVNGSLGKVTRFMSESAFERFSSAGLELPEDHSGEETDTISPEHRKRLNELGGKPLADTARRFPVVRFLLPGGAERELLLNYETWKIELPNGEVQAHRSQLPLILAWALSIHKAQGQTLERVKVDLRKVFEKGQAYVALSRATTQEGLWVQNFNAKAVMAHPRVREFYNSLYSVDKVDDLDSGKAPKSIVEALMQQKKPAGRKEVKPSLPQPTEGGFDDEEEAMMMYG